MTNQSNTSIVINAGGNWPTGGSLYQTASGCFIRPLRGLDATTQVYYNTSTYELSYLTSSATTKNTIEDLNMDTTVINNLKPKTYYYNTDPDAGIQVGYIAEDVKELNPHFATYNYLGGDPVAINYNTILVFSTEEMKKRKQDLSNYKERLTNLKNNINELKDKTSILENQ